MRLQVFLSTPPSRVATDCGCFGIATESMFLSTPPSRVATIMRGKSVHDEYMFLSTPPSRVATVFTVLAGARHLVSIHATLAGGDVE